MSFLEQLIEEVRNYPSIWNKSLDEHRNLITRDNAGEKIAKELKKTADELKYEWKKLQDSHRQALARRKAKSGDAGTKMKPWKYEEQMSFLVDGLTPRSSQSNVSIDDQTNDISTAVDENVPEPDAETEPLESVASKSNEKIKNHSKKFKTGNNENVDGVLSYLREKNKDKKPAGELEYFFASACETTKSLPRILQLKVKADIMKILTNAETEYLNQQLSRSTSSNTIFSEISSPTYQPSPSPTYTQTLSPSYVSHYLPNSIHTHTPTPSPSYLPNPVPSPPYSKNHLNL